MTTLRPPREQPPKAGLRVHPDTLERSSIGQCAFAPFSQYIASDVKQFFARPTRKNTNVRSLKEIFADNLAFVMNSKPSLSTSGKLSTRAKWPRGKKAGEPISARMIDYAMDKRMVDAPSPTLDFVEGVARALGVQPWELLTDGPEIRREIIDRALSGTLPDVRPPDVPRQNPPIPIRPKLPVKRQYGRGAK